MIFISLLNFKSYGFILFIEKVAFNTHSIEHHDEHDDHEEI